MSSARALARLLWRPYVLWIAVPTGGLTLVVWALVLLVRGGAHGEEAQILREAELHLALGTVLLPMAFATWLGWSVHELLLCSFAPLLPGLRRRLLGALVPVGLVAAALTTWWCDEQPGAQSPSPFFALAFLCYALGIVWSDPRFAAWGSAARGLMQLVVLLPAFLAPEIVRAFEGAPLVLVPLALAAGAGVLLLPFRPAAMRTRALDPACSRSIAPQHAGQRVAWRPGRTLAGRADWTRAALHEGFGCARGGWVGALLVQAFAWSAVLVVIGLVLARLRPFEGRDAAGGLYALLAGARGEHGYLLPFALPIWATFVLLAPARLGGAGVVPLSRAARAHVAWRTGATVALGLALAFGLVLWAASELALAATTTPARVSGVPEFAHVLASILIASPVIHAARLRWLDELKPLRLHDAGKLGLLALVLALPAIALACTWRAGLRHLDAWAWTALVVLLVLGSQRLARAALERHFCTRDLAV